MAAQLITPPAQEPVTLSEAKAHLRLETALDDDYITALIQSARQYTEQICWRGLVTQTWELVLESFAGEDTLELGTKMRRLGGGQNAFAELPRGNLSSSGYLPWIELPKGNLGAVSSIKYTDVNGVIQTLSPSVYTVDAVDTPGRVRVASNQFWPATLWPQWDAVRIQYTVGWGFVGGVWQGPLPLKHALLLLISQLYEHRSPEVLARALVQIQFSYDTLIAPFRLNRL